MHVCVPVCVRGGQAPGYARTEPPLPGSALALKTEQAAADAAAALSGVRAADAASTANVEMSAAGQKGTVVATAGRTKRSAAVLAEKAFKDIDKRAKTPSSRQEEWLASVVVGSNLDARDATNTDPVWYKAKVIDSAGEKLKIHYHGFAQRFDQWMERDLAHLQPPGTKSETTPQVRSSTKEEFADTRQAKRPRTQASSPASTIGANGEPPEIVGDMVAVNVANYRLKIALLDPPRVVIRDMISFVCEMTDKDSAALNIKSLAHAIQCVASTFANSAYLFKCWCSLCTRAHALH